MSEVATNELPIDFVGIGAAKSGTTWLSDCLRAHAQIFIPKRKELIYFNEYIEDPCRARNHRHYKGLSWYHSHFKEAVPTQLRGEFSNHYMVDENAARAIHAYNPRIKLLAVLRNPVDRAFSKYHDNVQEQRFTCASFEHALKVDPPLLRDGLYAKQLEVYYGMFPRENIKVLLHDDLVRDSRGFLAEVFQFLDVEESFPEMLGRRSNETREVRISGLNRIITGTRRFIYRHNLQACLPVLEKTKIIALAEYIRDGLNTRSFKSKPQIQDSTREALKAYFRKDIEHLEKLIGRDLSSWK